MKGWISLDNLKRLGSKIILFSVLCSLFSVLLGCDAFVRKFTRKSKKKDFSREEMVLAPQEYKGPQMTQEELYRQYFLYWKSWHDELIQSLHHNANHKKQVYCVDETIKNLEQMGSLLNEAKKKGADIYINKLKELKDIIKEDIYGSNSSRSRAYAEQLKRNILRYFSYPKIKDYLK